MSDKHKLLFTMELQDSSELIWGNLRLVYPDGQEIDYLATSGLVGYQDKDCQWIRARGCIPQRADYSIPTTGYYLPTKGVEGMFFHITPDPVYSPNGEVVRGEFGIHHDAEGSTPGSAGCIVLRNRTGFKGFCERMEAIAKQGIQRIGLEVRYS